MSVNYNSRWTVIQNNSNYSPGHTPRILIQAESAGLDDSDRQTGQRVWINGTQVLSASAPRSYRATRLRYNNGWTYHSSNGYDVYGSSTNASNLLTYLNTFSTGDILILNTNDEPNNNRGVFSGYLTSAFKSKLQSSPLWESRCSHLLVAAKDRGVIFEDVQARYDTKGIDVTLYLG